MLNDFSPNMLKTYQTCPKKYHYKYIDKVNIPASSLPYEKGKKIHALANYFLRGINISRIETALSQTEKEIWELLLKNEFFQKDYVNSEFQLSCKIDQYWIGGRLDAVVCTADDYFILDYKTGATPQNAEYDYQTMVYLLSLDAFLNGKYSSLSFVYINLKDRNNYVIPFDQKVKQIYKQKITEICKNISADSIYNPVKGRCKYCEFYKICEDAG